MSRHPYNFSPGPAVLPESVLKQAQEELFALPGLGMSVLEISHRSSTYLAIHDEAKANLRQLLSIPENYEILFLQGGARLQFVMIPMNLARPGDVVQYLLSGTWSKKAWEEAEKIQGVTAQVVWDAAETDYDRLPDAGSYEVDASAAYAYFCSNETVQGVQFLTEPNVGNVPLVCDASSDFLCRPLNLEKYGLIYACAQKNAGPAGVTIVVVRKDLIDRSADELPGYLSYKTHAKFDSAFNTPPTFGVYIVNLVARWLLHDVGGVDQIFAQNQEKARLLYEVVDESDGFYAGHARRDSRSIMNVTFRLPNDDLQSEFVKHSEQRGLSNLKGHRSVGGIRASIYNAMPLDGVVALRDFMREFLQQHS